MRLKMKQAKKARLPIKEDVLFSRVFVEFSLQVAEQPAKQQ